MTTARAEPVHTFDDSAGYELFMGRWSRAACAPFLAWLAAPQGARWLDVGCGTGILAESILAACMPAEVRGVDPTAQPVEIAQRRLGSPLAAFQVADARALPFAASAFDVVASALAINFIADKVQALAEMRRVARPGGLVAGFVWEFAEERSPSGPIRRGLRAIGADAPDVPGTRESSPDALRTLFMSAGLREIETRTIDVTVGYPDFETFWRSQMPSYSPTTRTIAALSEARRRSLQDAVRDELALATDEPLAYSARANAIKARAE